jgi:biopolymer transport protein TolQ
MEIELSIIELILGASLVVKLVMLGLLLVSVYSWMVIFQKLRLTRQAADDFNHLEDEFWSGKDLSELHRDLAKKYDISQGPMAVFNSGMKEFKRGQTKKGVSLLGLSDSASRAMRVAQAREVDRLESKLSFLATVGSTSPYIGLFGTVWGIMNSFLSLGSIQTATLAAVAPGIAEALIATAMGLFAAIPAVVFYNHFTDNINRLELSIETFIEEFSSIMNRQLSDVD